MARFWFNINAGSSAITDTGPPVHGAISQMRWYPTTGDVGGDLRSMVNSNDTGEAWTFYNDNDCLGSASSFG